MYIEFVGSSGAGKSTMYRNVHESLKKSEIEVFAPIEVCFGKGAKRLLKYEKLANILLDFFSIPWFLFSLKDHSSFVRYAMKRILKGDEVVLNKLLITRSMVRKVGMYYYIAYRHPTKLVLVDEGVLNIGHNFLVNDRQNCVTGREVRIFNKLVPKPDKVVFVKADVQDIVKRIVLRKDKSRRLQGKNKANIENFAMAAVSLFECLYEDSIKENWLTVRNSNNSKSLLESNADEIRKFLLNS